MLDAASPEAAPLGRLKIMVIDDNQPMRTIISSVLHGVGMRQIYEFADAVSALEALSHVEPDIILVDYQLTPIDGIEFTRWIRTGKTRITPYAPVIMISGHSQKSKVEAARDAGITEYVTKPLSARALMSRIHAVIHSPRPFIRCSTYFGPDRRRRGNASYAGPLRRQGERNEVEV